jgi:heme exporter protein A
MLSVTSLSFERYYQPVFEPVSFAVGPGDLLLVTGNNGSGKTTLIRMLAGLLRPSEGTISMADTARAYVGHRLGIKDDLTVTENLEFMQRVMGRAGTDTGPALDRLGLMEVREREARNLSAGQRKRCALARLQLGEAPLWLLDEPYTNLDAAGMEIVDGMLQEHVAGGGACVMSTHGQLRPKGLETTECTLSAGPAQ